MFCFLVFFCGKIIVRIENSEVPDQTALNGAVKSGSAISVLASLSGRLSILLNRLSINRLRVNRLSVL